MGFEPHVLTEVVRQSDPEFIGQLNRARIGDRDCIGYFNERSVSDRKRAPADDLWLCATNRMASTINDERVGELERMGARARTYTAYSYGDVKPSDKPTDDKLRLVEGARAMLLANMPDHGLANGSLGTVLEAGVDCVTVEFDDCEYPVEVSEKEWKVLKSSVRDFIGDDGNPAQELVTDTVGAFTQIPLRLAFAITIHKSQGQTFERCAVHSKVFGAGMLYVAVTDTVGAFTQIPLRLAFAITIHKSQGQTFERCAVHSKVFGAGMLYVALSRCTTAFTQIPLRLAFAITIHKSQGQTFERCAVHSKVFGAGMLYVALSRCTTFDGLTVWPKIERQRLYANESVIEFYDSLAAKVEEVHEPSQGALFDVDAPTLTVWPKIERQRLYANESVIEFYDSLAAKVEEVHEPSQGALFDVDAPTASLAASTESTEPMKPGDEDKVYIKCPAHIAERVRGYIDALMEGADGGYNQSCTQVAE